jgi:two-component system, chemotaxis family, chemotaxis protein CheY
VSTSNFVLVIDDDDGIRESISTLLEDEGYDVVVASDGKEALEVLRLRGTPAVILLDLMMPVMDGAEFRTRQLADATLADVPVVLITAAGARSAQSVSAQDVLLKPLHADALLQMVGKYCPAPTPSR